MSKPPSAALSSAPAPTSSPPKFFGLFRHTDGGIYRFVMTALHSDDKAELYIYEHLWPFERGVVWARPAAEWASRFTPISAEALADAMQQDNRAAREAVHKAKLTRREAAGKPLFHRP